ncbi:MAG: hypothetical protein ACXVRD_07695 [Gaiellaceae bacterium]
MRIPRLTLVGLLVLSAGALLLFEAMSAGAAQSKRFHYTHLVSITGQLVDHWTINDSGYCGLVGDGTVTVDYKTTKPALARPFVDPYAGLHGSWVLGVPAGGGVGHMPPKPATGTITRVDNTTKTLPPDGDCGGPPDKSGCGTVALVKPLSVAQGYDLHRLWVDLGSEEFQYSHGKEVACHIGELDLFSSPPSLAGGTRKGELLLKMPRASVLRRRLVKVKGSSHKHSAYTSGDVTYTEDVTRTVTVTFKHR